MKKYLKFPLVALVGLGLLFSGCDTEVDEDNNETAVVVEPVILTIGESLLYRDMVLPVSYNGRINFNADSSEEHYGFSLKQGEYLLSTQILDNSIEGSDSLMVSFFTKDGVEIFQEDLEIEALDFEHYVLGVPENGEYYLTFSREEPLLLSYGFSLTQSVENGYLHNEKYENNNVSFLAAPVEFLKLSNEGVENSLNLELMDNADWYEVSLEKTGDYYIRLEILDGMNDNFNGGLNAYIYDEYNRAVKTIESTELLSKRGDILDSTFNIVESGKYKILFASANDKPIKYKFNIYPSVMNGYLHDENNEINNVKFMAKHLSLDDVFEGINDTLHIQKNDTVDFFGLYLEVGDYSFIGEFLDGSFDDEIKPLEIEITNSLGRTVLEINDLNQSGDISFKRLRVLKDDDFKISVKREGDLESFYNFRVSDYDPLDYVVEDVNASGEDLNVSGEDLNVSEDVNASGELDS